MEAKLDNLKKKLLSNRKIVKHCVTNEIYIQDTTENYDNH